MKKLFVFVLAALSIVACNNASKNAEVTEEKAMTVDELFGKIGELVDSQVVVMGEVDHVCKHGGTKMVIFNPETQNSIHVNAGESGNFRADQVKDQDVKVWGKVEEFKVDDAYIAELEAQLKDDMAKGQVDEATAEKMDKSKKSKKIGEASPEDDLKHKQEFIDRQTQIDDMKKELADLKAKGKDHISYYSVSCKKYEVIEEKENKTK
ncbi:MAG: hypothetical protein AUJ98_01160 [Bacteroidetes bacterium CG2_30_33_31]|nr:MAG: hypothetical protein AUJ98_01160 [Bacteroidetes bacterium CG2_30_33_31]